MIIKQKLIDLNEISDMFSDLKNENLKDTLNYKLSEELESVINKYEALYYKAHSNRRYRKRLITHSKNDRHDAIINTHNTLNTFMPYILLHNLVQ